MSVLLIDTRQHAGKHETKNQWWERHGVPTAVKKLDFGDYMTHDVSISIDTKRGIGELAGNLCGSRAEHERFKRECIRASDAGCKLIVLVEDVHKRTEIRQIATWVNDRCIRCGVCHSGKAVEKCVRYSAKPVSGIRLYKTMHTMTERYGVEFRICAATDSARLICDILGLAYKL
jgi:hypothetical protein